jgi:hypothetical protein
MGYTLKLISEHIDHDTDYLIEQDEKTGKKNYKIKGIFMQADIKNRNGRMYPMEILEKEVNRYNKEYVDQNRAFGELGHPEGPTVNLERASHMITSLKANGKNFIGEAKILSTPMGQIVSNLMDDGAKLGVSSRGMGSLDQKNGANVVRNDFYLATAADIVADPSAPNAFVEGIFEGKEWIWNNGLIQESEVQQIKDNIEENHRTNNSAADSLEFARFLQKL